MTAVLPLDRQRRTSCPVECRVPALAEHRGRAVVDRMTRYEPLSLTTASRRANPERQHARRVPGEVGVPDLHGGAPNEVDRRMALAREWDTLVAQVRELPGFEDFLQPPSLEKLLPAAVGGPVVIVNVSRWRCDALIVTSEGVHTCELPRLTLHDCVDRANAYLNVLRAAEHAYQQHVFAVIAADQNPARAAFQVLHEAAATVQSSDLAADDMLSPDPEI